MVSGNQANFGDREPSPIPPITTMVDPEWAARLMRAGAEERRRIGRLAIPEVDEVMPVAAIDNRYDPKNILPR